MLRRRRQPSIIEIALVENWKVSAVLAILFGTGAFFLVPLLQTASNPYLKIVAIAAQPIGLILAGVFGLIGIFKVATRTKRNAKPAAGMAPSGNLAAIKAMERTWKPPEIGRAVAPLHERPDTWTLAFLQSIEWKRFEELATAYYEEKGIRAEATPLGADGGIDIKLFQADTNTPTSIVQCKAWSTKPVGVKEMREFYGVMNHEKIGKGFYMTSGSFTPQAMAFAKESGITPITGEMLLMMLERLPEASSRKLLMLAAAGDYTTPTCPTCGVKMSKRSGRRGEFWGCKNFPRCRQRLYIKKAEALQGRQESH